MPITMISNHLVGASRLLCTSAVFLPPHLRCPLSCIFMQVSSVTLSIASASDADIGFADHCVVQIYLHGMQVSFLFRPLRHGEVP